MCNFSNCPEFNESMTCASDCVFGSKRIVCNYTSINFEQCDEVTHVIPARVTNVLSVPEFICDAYLSVIRPAIIDSLVRHGTIRENAALDKILQSRHRRVGGYISIFGRNLLSVPLSFFELYPCIQWRYQ